MSLAMAAGYLAWPDSAKAWQANPRRKLYAAVLNQAIATGDIAGAIKTHGRGLEKNEAGILLSLTPQELAVLGSFRARLGKLGVLVRDQ